MTACPIHPMAPVACLECVARFGQVFLDPTPAEVFLYRATATSPKLHSTVILVISDPDLVELGLAQEFPPTIRVRASKETGITPVTLLHEAAHLEGFWEHGQDHQDAMLRLACTVSPDLIRGFGRIRQMEHSQFEGFLAVYFRKNPPFGLCF